MHAIAKINCKCRVPAIRNDHSSFIFILLIIKVIQPLLRDGSLLQENS
jgi:hypothetical protein